MIMGDERFLSILGDEPVSVGRVVRAEEMNRCGGHGPYADWVQQIDANHDAWFASWFHELQHELVVRLGGFEYALVARIAGVAQEMAFLDQTGIRPLPPRARSSASSIRCSDFDSLMSVPGRPE